jgi:xylulokinase
VRPTALEASPLVIGVDASTTGVKALVVDVDGHVVSAGRASYALSRTGDGGAEQSALDWLEATLAALAGALSRLDPESRSRVAALSIAHQRESFVVTDASGEPLAPALVWMDARCADEVGSAASELAPELVHRLSGKVASTTPSLYKLRFFFERLHPELARADKRVCDVHAYLVWKLTGELVTSLASADPLGLVDLGRRAWSEELCRLARLRESELPRLVEPGSVVGRLSPELCDELGLGPDVLVVAGAGDGQAAGLGTGVLEAHQCYLNLGTALVAGRPSVELSIDRAFRTLYAGDGAGYLLETDLLGGTLTLDWLVDVLLDGGRSGASMLGGEERARRLAELEAARCGAATGERGPRRAAILGWRDEPYWSADATGVLFGLRIDHGPEHVYQGDSRGARARAAPPARGSRREESDPRARSCVTGGGAQRELFAQITSDVLGRSLQHVDAVEATALGAAVLAQASLDPTRTPRDVARRWNRRARLREPSRHDARLRAPLPRGLLRALRVAALSTRRALELAQLSLPGSARSA